MYNYPSLYVEQSMVETNNVIAASQDTLSSFSYVISKKIADFLNLPDVQTLQNVDWTNLNSIFSLISSKLIATIFTVAFLWLLYSFGIYKMAKKRDDNLAFLAFIPYFSFYTIGKIVGPIKIYSIEITKPEYLLPAIILSMYLPFTGTISVILFVIIYNTFLAKIYKRTCYNLYYFLTIVSILFPFLQPIILFAIRNKLEDISDKPYVV